MVVSNPFAKKKKKTISLALFSPRKYCYPLEKAYILDHEVQIYIPIPVLAVKCE